MIDPLYNPNRFSRQHLSRQNLCLSDTFPVLRCGYPTPAFPASPCVVRCPRASALSAFRWLSDNFRLSDACLSDTQQAINFPDSLPIRCISGYALWLSDARAPSVPLRLSSAVRAPSRCRLSDACLSDILAFRLWLSDAQQVINFSETH